MGNSDSFDLLNSSNATSKSKKEANSIYNFDLNGIFRRIGDIEAAVSIADTTDNDNNNNISTVARAAPQQVDKSTNNSTAENDDLELVESDVTNSSPEEFNERLIDGVESESSSQNVSIHAEEEELKVIDKEADQSEQVEVEVKELASVEAEPKETTQQDQHSEEVRMEEPISVEVEPDLPESCQNTVVVASPLVDSQETNLNDDHPKIEEDLNEKEKRSVNITDLEDLEKPSL